MAYQCTKCGGVGHNRRTCGKSPAMANVTKTREASISKASKNSATPTISDVASKFQKLTVKQGGVSQPTLMASKNGNLGQAYVLDVATETARIDFQRHGLEVDYDESRSCMSSGCYDDGICRCSEIGNAQIRNVDIPEIADQMLHRMRCSAAGISPYNYLDRESAAQAIDRKHTKIPRFNQVDKAALERLLVHETKAYDPNTWDIAVERGYYGDEIDSVTINHPQGPERTLSRFLTADSNTRMKQALEAEYGYSQTHTRFDGKTFSVKTVPLDQVRTSERDPAKQKNPRYTPSSTSGVLLYENGEYTLVDGYHRFDALQKSGSKEATFVVAE